LLSKALQAALPPAHAPAEEPTPECRDGTNLDEERLAGLSAALLARTPTARTGSAPRPEPAGREGAARVAVIGDAHEVRDIFSAVRAGYPVALET